jgi:hypothetical protein
MKVVMPDAVHEPVYVVMYIWGFWLDSHSSPAEVVAICPSAEAAVAAATDHHNRLVAEAHPEGGQPTATVHTWSTKVSAGEAILSDPKDGQMWYAIGWLHVEQNPKAEVMR